MKNLERICPQCGEPEHFLPSGSVYFCEKCGHTIKTHLRLLPNLKEVLAVIAKSYTDKCEPANYCGMNVRFTNGYSMVFAFLGLKENGPQAAVIFFFDSSSNLICKTITMGEDCAELEIEYNGDIYKIGEIDMMGKIERVE